MKIIIKRHLITRPILQHQGLPLSFHSSQGSRHDPRKPHHIDQARRRVVVVDAICSIPHRKQIGIVPQLPVHQIVTYASNDRVVAVPTTYCVVPTAPIEKIGQQSPGKAIVALQPIDPVRPIVIAGDAVGGSRPHRDNSRLDRRLIPRHAIAEEELLYLVARKRGIEIP